MAKIFNPTRALRPPTPKLSQAEIDENLAKFREQSAIRTRQYHGTVEVGNPGASGERLGFTEFKHKSEINRLRPPEGVKFVQSEGYPGDDIGFHFGTPDQAYIRMKDKSWSADIQGSTFQQGQIEDFHLQVKNPLIVTGDAGNWTSPKDINSVLPVKYQAKTVGEIRRNIQEDGFDGIIYPNEHERVFPGIGKAEKPLQNSTIIFDRRQAKSATRNIGTYDITKADFTKAAVPAAVVGGASVASAQEVEPQRKVNGFRPDDPVDQVLLVLQKASADKLKVDSERQLPSAKPIQQKGLPELPKDPEMKLTSREDFHKFSGGRKQVPTREESIRAAEKKFAGGMVGGPLEYTGIGDIRDFGRAIKDPSLLNVIAAGAGLIPVVGKAKKVVEAAVAAQKAASKTARWKRAVEQGYTIDAFHGTGQSFVEFDLGKRGTASGARGADYGFFFTDDPQAAMTFAEQAAAKTSGTEKIMPVKLKMEDPYVVDFKEKNIMGADISKYAQEARALGHDGMVIKRRKYPADPDSETSVYMVFEPQQIRHSGARFDSELSMKSTVKDAKKEIFPEREKILNFKKDLDEIDKKIDTIDIKMDKGGWTEKLNKQLTQLLSQRSLLNAQQKSFFPEAGGNILSNLGARRKDIATKAIPRITKKVGQTILTPRNIFASGVPILGAKSAQQNQDDN